MNYRWILFDLDGTLFDYDASEEAALRSVWEEAGFEPRADLLEVYREINRVLWLGLEAGTTTPDEIKLDRFRQLLGTLELQGDAEAMSASYLTELGSQTHLLPGAEELLDGLAARRRLALITNGLSQVQRSRLASSSIGHHFEVFVISEEVGFAKPDPRIFDVALNKMGSPAREEVLMVGDNVGADIEGAHRAGIDSCWLNYNGNHDGAGTCATFEIRQLQELESLLED